MTDTPSNWRCDTCCKSVDHSDDGAVFWVTDEDMHAWDFKIVHNKVECAPKHHPSDGELDEFLGPDGLAYLLGFLSRGPLSKHSSCRIKPEHMDGFVDFFRRVQTAHYEQARRKFSSSTVSEQHDGYDETYTPATLKLISKH